MCSVDLEETYFDRHLSGREHKQSLYIDDFSRKEKLELFRNRHDYASVEAALNPDEDTYLSVQRMHSSSDPISPHRDPEKENSDTFSLDTRVLQPLKGHLPLPTDSTRLANNKPTWHRPAANEVFLKLDENREQTFRFTDSQMLDRLKSVRSAKKLSPELFKKTHDILTNDPVAKLYRHNLTYASAAMKAQADAAINYKRKLPPISANTLEEKADMLRDQRPRYAQKAADWQRVFDEWDRVQLRHPVDYYRFKTVEGSTPYKNPLEFKERIKPLYPPCDDKAALTVKEGMLHHNFERPLPDFSYHLPQMSLKEEMKVKEIYWPFVTMTMESYGRKPHPPSAMTNRHRGPFSRTATLLCPYNPYNQLHTCGNSISFG